MVSAAPGAVCTHTRPYAWSTAWAQVNVMAAVAGGAVGVGTGRGRSVAVARGRGVAVGWGRAVAVGASRGSGAGVKAGVAVGSGVGVGATVGVAVGDGVTMVDPTSARVRVGLACVAPFAPFAPIPLAAAPQLASKSTQTASESAHAADSLRQAPCLGPSDRTRCHTSQTCLRAIRSSSRARPCAVAWLPSCRKKYASARRNLRPSGHQP